MEFNKQISRFKIRAESQKAIAADTVRVITLNVRSPAYGKLAEVKPSYPTKMSYLKMITNLSVM